MKTLSPVKLKYQVITGLVGLLALRSLAPSQTWIRTSAAALPWRTVACSADGLKLVAAGYHGIYQDMRPWLYLPSSVYISADAGLTWVPTSAPSNDWVSVALSADGSNLVAVASPLGPAPGNAGIYVSSDAGLTWTRTPAPTNHWTCIACSMDGAKLIAAGLEGIYVSSDSGLSWMRTASPNNNWTCVACSADASKLFATATEPGQSIYSSTNLGATWFATDAPTNSWTSIACSADGSRLVAGGGFVCISTNSGTAWTQTGQRGDFVASSADGTTLLAVPSGYGSNPPGSYASIYKSANAGSTWKAMPISGLWYGPNAWFAIASSANGNRSFAAGIWGDYYNSYDAGIYAAVPENVEPWKVTSLPGNYFDGSLGDSGIASSTNGSKLIALAYAYSTNQERYALIFISHDAGVTWQQALIPGRYDWTSVAGSEDSTKMIVAGATVISNHTYSVIFSSSDSGATWVQTETGAPTNAVLTSMVSSADGRRLAGAAWGGSIYTSINSGLNWTQSAAPTNYWTSITSSRDGTKLVAVSYYAPDNGYPNPGSIYTSSDSGTTWTPTTAPSNYWRSVATSADGTKQIAAGFDFGSGYGVIFTSSDSGAIWNQTTAPTNYAWSSVASSSDGKMLVAAAQGDFNSLNPNYPAPGLIYYSSNSGSTWIPAPLPREEWFAVTCSGDGAKVVGLAEAGVLAEPDYEIGRIYSLSNLFLRVLPSPRLSIAPSAGTFKLSWLVPSRSFALQENSDLTTTNWMDVPTSPTLNFTNLCYQVTISPVPGSHFYRLEQQ